ncbi:MAG: hypothetical protein M5U05_13535 [Anaerolineales bacterium]|nr:hypothetical protein [Anaerolineales bacterium]
MLLSISALPSATAPASVIGAVPPIIGAGEWVIGMAWRAEQQFVGRFARMLERRARLGIDQEGRALLQGFRPARRRGAHRSDRLQVSQVVAHHHHRLGGVFQDGGILKAVINFGGHVARHPHRHHKVDLGQRVGDAHAVRHVRQAEIAPLPAARVEVMQRVGAGAEVHPLTVQPDGDRVRIAPVQVEGARRARQRPLHQRRRQPDPLPVNVRASRLEQLQRLSVKNRHPGVVQNLARRLVDAQTIGAAQHLEIGFNEAQGNFLRFF